MRSMRSMIMSRSIANDAVGILSSVCFPVEGEGGKCVP